MVNDQTNKENSPLQHKRIQVDSLVHDLKSPLGVIETDISSLLRREEKYGPLTDQQKKILFRVLRNTKVAQNIVNGLMELGKAREGIVNLTNCSVSFLILSVLMEIFDMTDVNTSEKIKSCADLPRLRELLQEQGVIISIDEGLWCQELCLDEPKIKQILRNLMNNAMKYRKSRVELEVDCKDGCLAFSVKDDGKGILPIYHKKIFETYFQVDNIEGSSIRGHGIGLAGVMVLVEDMGGKFFLESAEGKGAKFMVKIPLMNN